MTQNLLGFSQPQLEGFFSQLGEKPFRARQLMKWIYRQEVTDFADMTDLSKSLRVRLTQCAKIQPPKIVHQHVSTDGTYKWLVELEDGNPPQMAPISGSWSWRMAIASRQFIFQRSDEVRFVSLPK